MKHYLFLIMFFLPFLMSAQQGTLADESKQKLVSLMKDLYVPGLNMTFNITLKDAQSNYAEMPDEQEYTNEYLDDLLDLESKDTSNAINIANLAEFYTKTGDYRLANQYYLKALNHLDMETFGSDSAAFYAYRGLLKANLYDSTAYVDFNRAVDINPNDSISTYFYPLVLLSTGNYQGSIDFTKKILDKKVDRPSVPYLYFVTAEVFKKLSTISAKASDRKRYAETNYDEMIDYGFSDKYFMKYKNNVKVQNCKILGDLLGLFPKMMFFQQDDKKRISIRYTDYEKNKIRDIIKQLNDAKTQKRLNEYTANNCLGYAYFMLENYDKSLEYFQNAVQVFPKSKKDGLFDVANSQDMIIANYYQKADTTNFRKSLDDRISKAANKMNTIDDLVLLAFEAYQAGELNRAEAYCNKIRDVDYNNFDALRLLSHLNFLQELDTFVEFYGEKASQSRRNDADTYNLLGQFAIYRIYNGSLDAALENINIMREMDGEAGCKLCDDLMSIIETSK